MTKRIRNLLLVFSLLPLAARPAAIRSGGAPYLQAGGAPLGKLNVSPAVMASHCITRVSPHYPQGTDGPPVAATVIVRVVIWKSGEVSPMRVVSGKASLENEAMNAVRLWRYKPFLRDGEAVDVTTDIQVDFDPGKPGGLVTHPGQ